MQVLSQKVSNLEPGVLQREPVPVRKIALLHPLEKLFVAEQDGVLAGGIMAGYDGHRGWLYSLAVLPDCRRSGIGSALVEHAESCLSKLGCVKINLHILEENYEVVSFYEKQGYKQEPRISMGKELSDNI